MKIYGDCSLFTDRMGIRNPSQMKVLQGNMKIAEFADKFIEQHKAAGKDQMTVSKEGMDYIREQLLIMETRTDSVKEEYKDPAYITQGGITSTDKLFADIIKMNSDTVNEYGVSSRLYLDINSEYLREMEGRDSRDWDSHMEALAKAYASVRKKITEGYENGTRTVWIQDDSTGEDFSGVELEIDGQTVRYRKLTKEEEIGLLDKAIDKFTEKVAEWYVKEEESIRKEEAEKEAYKAGKGEDIDWTGFVMLVNGLVNEARNLLDRVRQEIERIEKMSQKEIDFEGRMEAEAYNHREETIVRGRQQTKINNYRKMSQMASDVMTLWGNIKA